MPRDPRRAQSQVWMITFADLLSLMLAFFVLLFSMSKVETEPWKALVEALSKRLNPFSEWSQPELQTERETPIPFAKRTMDLDYLAGVLRNKLADNEILASSILHRLDGGLVVSLPGDHFFPAGRARLLDSGQDAIVALASALNQFGNSIELVGHTEAQPPAAGSPFNSNWDLGLARALRLANGLLAVGYEHSIKVLGAADAAHRDLSSKLPETRRQSLSRRIDLIIRETSAGGGADAP